jgi:predicted AAA+ superfamily ATPase
LAQHPFQDIATIAAEIGESARRLSNQLIILEELFAIAHVEASSLGAGKSRYFVTDSGFATTLGCSDRDAIRLWLANEICAQFAYAGEDRPRLEYFRSKNGSVIDFLLPDRQLAILVTDEELVHEYTLRAAKSFAARHKEWRVIVASPRSAPTPVEDRVRVEPWSRLC